MKLADNDRTLIAFIATLLAIGFLAKVGGGINVAVLTPMLTILGAHGPLRSTANRRRSRVGRATLGALGEGQGPFPLPPDSFPLCFGIGLVMANRGGQWWNTVTGGETPTLRGVTRSAMTAGKTVLA